MKPRIYFAGALYFIENPFWLCYMPQPARDAFDHPLPSGRGDTPAEAYADWQRRNTFPQEVYA